MNTLTVVVPAYNEEASLGAYLPQLIARARSEGWRLIVVNDGSSDGTGRLLDAAGAAEVLTVFHHKLNRGYGAAIKTGLEATETRYAITIDADGQHALDDIVRLHKEIEARNADLIVGRREGGGSGWYREMGKALIRFVARRLMPLTLHDLNSGMKIYDTALAKKYLVLCPDKMAFSDIITLIFISQKHLVLESPIRIQPRIAGKSTISSMTALETIDEILNMVVLFNPTRIFYPLAALSVIAGIAWGIPIVLRGNGVSVGAMLAVVTGLILFFLGLVAEQISQIRRRG